MAEARLQDVADRAGVSIATASRALGTGHPMRSETRRKVLDAAESLGYRARQRFRAEPGVVAIVAGGFSHRAIEPMISQINQAAEPTLCSLMVTAIDPDREAFVVENLVNQSNLQGVIVLGGIITTMDWQQRMAKSVKRLRSRNVPVVFCGRGGDLGVPGVVEIDYNQRRCAMTSVDHLVQHGHRTIGVVRGPAGFTTSDERSRGYRDGLIGYGLEACPELEVHATVRAPEPAAVAASILLTRRPDITAVLCESDAMAIGVMSAGRELGRRLPDDLSVIGFDDMFGVDRLTPALTTIRMPAQGLARHAVRLALGPAVQSPTPQTLQTDLIVRASVTTAPIA